MTPAPFAAFYFDCDSTLSEIEGVDELTRNLDPSTRRELQELTQSAMEGALPLADVYERRLAALAPSRRTLEDIGNSYIEHLVPDAASTLEALRSLGKHVGIISGGLLQAVSALAKHLGIEDANVHAVPVILDESGSYVDFDRKSPLWRNQGKVHVLESLPDDRRPLLFMGDGVTDLEAQGTVDLFVGFGGVETRARVAEEAEVFVTRKSLAAVLDVGLTAEEKATLHSDPKFYDLLRNTRK